MWCFLYWMNPLTLMQHSEISDWLGNRLSEPLPGLDAQMEMASWVRKEKIKRIKVPDNAKQSAVLILLYPGSSGEVLLPLQERTAYKGVHSRQIGLPGGGVEDIDRHAEDTALRETQEELGVDPKDVEVLGRLSPIYIPPSNYLVQPVVGVAYAKPSFVLDPVEVKALLEAHIHDFTGPGAVQSGEVSIRDGQKINVPCFKVQGHIVWGATAMIMSEFRSIIAERLS